MGQSDAEINSLGIDKHSHGENDHLIKVSVSQQESHNEDGSLK
jgi:hypothetical protein